MALFDRHCPVDARAQGWVQDSMRWFAGQFGAAMLDQPVVLPTHEFFPPPYQGSDEDIRAAVRRVAGYMGLPAGQVTVRCTDGLDPAGEPGLPAQADVHGTAGQYLRYSGQDVITIDRATAAQPAVLLAVIAHELGHVRLLGENRISPGQRDGEQLADLVTVYLGMGIFTANAAFDFSHGADSGQASGHPAISYGGWHTQRLGYLDEQMFGYGLACYAWLRREPQPDWARYLDTNPRTYMKHGLAYLNHTAADGRFPHETPHAPGT